MLPLLLTATAFLWHEHARRSNPELPALATARLFCAALLAVLSHVALDWLNTYGIRLWMPFDGRWSYGDALFIIDPILWALLGGALLLARFGRVWPALALAAVAAYALAMAGAGAAAERATRAQLQAAGVPCHDVLASPVFGRPLLRNMLIVEDGGYRLGRYRVDRHELALDERLTSAAADNPVVAAALAEPAVHGMRTWMRYPWYEIESSAEGYTVWIRDARYVHGPLRAGFGVTAVQLDPTLRPAPPHAAAPSTSPGGAASPADSPAPRAE